MANADYQKLCIEFARVLQEDLSGLLGAQLRVRGPEIDVVDQDQAGGDGSPLVATTCQVEGDGGHALVLAVPRADAVTLAGLLTALSAEDIEARRAQAPDEETTNAIGEVMKSAAAILSRVCEAEGLPAPQAGEPQMPESPQLDASWIAPGSYRRARWTAGLGDHPDAHVDLLLGEAALSDWFGEAVGEGAGATATDDTGAADAGAEADEEEGSTLVVIDASEADREAIENLEDDIALGVWALDPGDLTVAGFDELADARAIVVDWSARHCSALEILHALRSHPTTAKKRIAVCSERPTRRMVALALRHGADSFVMKPYRADEIRARFGLSAAPPAAAPEEPAEDDASPDGETESPPEDAPNADDAGEDAGAEA